MDEEVKRVLDRWPNLVADGPTQMAVDAAMLAQAVDGRASIRFYRWSEPTLSLGYFQRASEIPLQLQKLPLVRRETGGGAILHDQELTYAVALPKSAGISRSDLMCLFHKAVRESLREFKVEAGGCGAAEERGRDEFLCFLHHSPGDVILCGHKVMGSAQRQRHGAILQHGSILFAANAAAPQITGVADLAGVELPGFALTVPILQRLETTFDIRHVPALPFDNTTIRALRDERFSRDDWNRKR